MSYKEYNVAVFYDMTCEYDEWFLTQKQAEKYFWDQVKQIAENLLESEYDEFIIKLVRYTNKGSKVINDVLIDRTFAEWYLEEA